MMLLAFQSSKQSAGWGLCWMGVRGVLPLALVICMLVLLLPLLQV